jgi:hypothetical protein
MKTVKVIRGFMLGMEPQLPGKVVEVSDALAAELAQNGAVEYATAKPQRRGPMTTESAPALAGKVATDKE